MALRDRGNRHRVVVAPSLHRVRHLARVGRCRSCASFIIAPQVEIFDFRSTIHLLINVLHIEVRRYMQVITRCGRRRNRRRDRGYGRRARRVLDGTSARSSAEGTRLAILSNAITKWPLIADPLNNLIGYPVPHTIVRIIVLPP